jgi:predicted nucleotidyltransferase
MTQTTSLLTNLQQYFQSESRIYHAWLFGSFARGDYHENSDVDVMIEMKNDKRYTLYDVFDIQYRLEKLLNRKVDIVEKGFLKQAARADVERNLITII